MDTSTPPAQPLTIPLSGEGQVSGLLVRPESAFALLVLAHGAGAGMRHRFMEAMAEGLAGEGVATLRYQFPYTEAGRRSPDRPPLLVRTVEAALAAGGEHAGGLPVFAGGKSMGGRMTSTAAAEKGWANGPAAPRGLVFLGFPLHAPGKPSTNRGDHLARVRLPMLFLQGTRDTFATPELLGPVVGALGPLARLHPVEGADHGFGVLKRSGRDAAGVLHELASVTAAWMRPLAARP